MYKCHVCGRQFRCGKRITDELLWYEYLQNKQTYREISFRYGISESTVKRKIHRIKEPWNPSIPNKGGFLLLDTTYFGRNWGVLVAMDVESVKVLYRKYVKHERISEYIECVISLENQGYKIRGIVIDGMRGLFQALSRYPIQMCHFHQCAILKRYLTSNPKLEANKELLQLSRRLSSSSKNEFICEFEKWENKWNDFLNERSVNPLTGKSHYIHKRLRSARRSLKTNLPYLFVFQETTNIGLPNTNNSLEGKFTDLKKNLNNHSGMNKENRKRFIDGLFKA